MEAYEHAHGGDNILV